MYFDLRLDTISPRQRIDVTVNQKDHLSNLMIAATGLHHGLTIVSRDVVDYEKTRVPLFNPLKDSLPACARDP